MFTFGSQCKWQDQTRITNWYEKILYGVENKYDMLYPTNKENIRKGTSLEE